MRGRCIAVLLLASACTRTASPEPSPPRADAASPVADSALAHPDAALAHPFCTERQMDPPRTILERPCGTRQAVLTDGAHTVLVEGAERLFTEPSAGSAVRTTGRVRLLPAPYPGSLDDATARWVDAALDDASPDVLALAMQYLEGAPAIVEKGVQVAGDADYGPLSDLQMRLEGADFNDYLGLRWTYPDGTLDKPKSEMLHSLDCSGYMRMIWGYRSGLPLAPAQSNTALSRRAVQMDAATFGVTIIANGQPAALERLQTGDLVFFDADPGDGPAVDHVGMYLGRDDAGHSRFISSRKSPNGPTLGDVHGASILDGAGLYAKAFRSARRL
jgi:cell wall-associated NlpC family hydrolase